MALEICISKCSGQDDVILVGWFDCEILEKIQHKKAVQKMSKRKENDDQNGDNSKRQKMEVPDVCYRS